MSLIITLITYILCILSTIYCLFVKNNVQHAILVLIAFLIIYVNNINYKINIININIEYIIDILKEFNKSEGEQTPPDI
jgi:hypothetical protein